MGKNYGSGVIIESGASYFIDDGDRITAPTVNYNGRLIVGSGGTALEIRENGGYVAIASGALVTFVPNAFSHLDLTTDQASWRQSTTVHSGTTANNTNIYSDYHLRIHNGGTANYTSIHRLGHLEVFGGIANHTTIDSLGGFLVIYDGATANNTVIEQGAGSMTIQSGGVANNTDDGGDLYVYGKANETNIYRKMFVCENGEANDTNVLSGGRLYVSSGGVVNRTTVSSGSMFVELGGVANSVNVISRGRLTVSVGGQVNYATIDRTGAVFLEAGGDANDVTVSSGGYLDISDGATASGIVVSSGGHLLFDVAPGNNVQGTKGGKTFEMKNGALSNYTVTRDTDSAGNTFALLVFSGGVANNTTVSSGGSMIIVDAGAVVNSTTVLPNASLILSQGATVNYTVFSSSTFTVGDSMTLNNTTVKDGYLNVSSNGYANVTVLSNGSMSVSDGGVATETTVKNGCILDVGATGLVTNTIVNSGGSMQVIGSANMTTVKKGGMLDVLAGGAVNGTILSSGGSARISGNAANTTVNQSGSDVDAVLTICDGGKATRTTVNDRGYAIVSSGGQATSTTINYGEMTLLGGTAKSTTVNSGGRLTVSAGGTTMYSLISSGGILDVSSGGMTTATTLNDGAMYLSGGATLHSANVNSGGYLYIYSDAITDQIYEGGGYVDVQKGAEANFASTTFNKMVFSRASATVHSGTNARIITLEQFGYLHVFSGGRVVAVTVSSGGRLYLSGGIASGTTISSGGFMYVSSGATVTGTTYFADGALVSAYDGSILEFDPSRITSANPGPLVNDLSRINGTPLYTLKVNGSLSDDTYKLAGGAAGFNKTISVVNSGGETLGTLSLGKTVNIGVAGYTLNLGEDNVLSVSVGAAAPSGPAKGDIDGNGVSDVLFQYTGGDYQLGYWMNGTNEWRGQGLAKPAVWEVLGSYDMNSNGKADAVLVGNVTTEIGGKGAYIGYYLDSVDSDSNWQNIGYLNNEEDIAWKNKVGNLTGNAGKNSIVWYAPELFALGAWTDSTTEWVNLSASFGGDDWTLVGCGDFNGDGKDSVVMNYNKGQLFYEVEIGGKPAALGSADWRGWEIRAIGDFAGDGKEDIVLFHEDTGSMVMCANGNLDSFVSIGQLAADDWFVVGAGDYNGDQMDDLLVRQKSTGMLGYYISGDTSQWVELGRGVDTNWTVIA